MALGRAGAEIAFDHAGGRVAAYLAIPAAGRGRGVLVAHEGFGLVDFVRDACDRLAREGFVALAPDCFGGRTASNAEEAGRLVGGLELEAVGALLDRAIAELLSCQASEGPRVGALGFCLGGHLALLAAARNRRVAAAVDFYGAPLPHLRPRFETLAAAVLGIFAERDDAAPKEAVEALRGELAAAGARAELRVWPGVRHGFMNDARADVYDAEAARRGWDTLLRFLRAELA